MSVLRALSPSIAALGFSAGVLGAGLSCALMPAWALGSSCAIEIADLIGSDGPPNLAEAMGGAPDDPGSPARNRAGEDEESCQKSGDLALAVRL
jgi:hypothetical protein